VTAIPVLRFLDLDIADMGLAAVADLLAARAATAPFAYVVTPNADHFVRLAREPRFQHVYAAAALRLLDSRLVARIAGTLGLAVPHVVRGSDLVADLLARHVRPGDRLTCIGLRAELLPLLRARLPGVAIAHHDPPMGFDRNAAAFADAVRFVCDHPGRFAFLAVGSPRQETLAAAIAATGRAKGVGLCVGTALALFVGVDRPAPGWMRRAGLEWLHRLVREPRRLGRRYLFDDPPIVALLLRERWRRRAMPARGRQLIDGSQGQP